VLDSYGVLHGRVAAGKQTFTGLVALDDGARPAAETGMAATGRASVDLDGTLAVGSAGVEFVRRAVVAAPRVRLLEEIGPNLLGGEEFDGVGNPDAREVGVTVQAVAPLAAGHGLRAGRAFGAARAEMENGFAPVAVGHAHLHKGGDGIDLEALGTPAENAIRRRVATADDVDPERLLRRRLEQLRLDVQSLLLRESAHAVEHVFHALRNRRDFHAGVGAQDAYRLRALLRRNGQHGFKDERGDQHAVLAAAEADEPGPGVFEVKLPKAVADLLKIADGHCGDGASFSGACRYQMRQMRQGNFEFRGANVECRPERRGANGNCGLRGRSQPAREDLSAAACLRADPHRQA